MNWPTVKLGDVCKIVSGSTPKTDTPEFWDGDILWATPRDLSRLNQMYLSDTEKKITAIGLKSCSAQMLPVGSVLFSSRAPIGHVAINTKPVCTNQGFKSFVIDETRLNNRFLFYWLDANRDYLQSLGNGATFKEVSKAIVSQVEIPLPPLAEQQRIAARLDAADRLRALRRDAVAALDALTHSLFLEMFGDPAHNPMNWPMEKLTEISRPKQWPTISASQLTGSGYPVFGANGLIGHHETFNHAERTVLITCRGATCGTINVCPPKTYVTGNAMALDDLAEDKIEREFLEWYLKEKGLAKVISGTAQPQITRQGLENYTVALPPLSLQREFAAQLGQIETVRSRMEDSRVRLDALFAALQSAAFEAG